jgi:polyhydroxyalkanoate synthesis regulator phasin
MGRDEDQGRLNAEEIKALSDELAALAKKQSDARETEVYIRMTPQEIKDFDNRHDRISRIYVILGKHDSKREST